jgi:hypothetical protein
VKSSGRAGLLLLVLGLATAVGASETRPVGPVIEGVRVGTAGDQLQLEVVASERLVYLLVDSTEPFTLTLFFANTAFSFPAWSREFSEGPLRRVAAVVLGRPEGFLARLELEFTRPVGYQVRQSGRWLVLSADVPGPPSPIVVGTVETAEPAPEPLVLPVPPSPAAPPPVVAAPAAPPAPAPPVPRVAPAPAPPPPGVAAPTAPPAPAPPAPRVASVPTPARLARVRRISPAGRADEVQVAVEADGPLAPRAFVLADPLRLVVDFENAATDLGQVSIPTGGGLVARVRSAQLRMEPTPVVRVVLDLLRPVSYRVEPHAGGATIRVGPGAAR